MSGITNEDLDALLTRLEQRRRNQPDATVDEVLSWLLAGIEAIKARTALTFPSATALAAVYRIAATLGANGDTVLERAYTLSREHPTLSPGDALLVALSDTRPDTSDRTPLS
jgi:hypothetical protein